MAERLLEVEGLTCGYGEAVVLSNVGFTLDGGRSLALLGRNGTGKTTLIDTLVGVTRRHAGRIVLGGQAIHAMPAHERAGAGVGWVPQERNIFKSLTVEENLTAVARPGPWTVRRVFELFPRLAERQRNLGTQLSGGEQQMLAFARALVLNPRLLLLDEPLEGLAPLIVAELLAAIGRVAREEGLSSIVVEQHPHMVLQVTDAAIVLDRGGVAFRSASTALLADPTPLDAWLGVSRA
ncbi:MAG TPA: ABC transporter ATP-binding protein [Burkholderiaceae bacterium]|nr:ABC transporter ATP-binding protein [Burkholderiaceae bacterium]